MSQRIGWTLPLLLGTLVCLAGCTFPKAFGLGRKQPPSSDAQVADDPAADAARNKEEVGPRKTSLVQTLRKPGEWFSLARRKASADDPAAPTDGASSSQPLTYPNVVPSKYRDMDATTPRTSVAKDASASPSLVRPSRRPPPDPAPKPPQQESLVAQTDAQPLAENPLAETIAAATRSWRTKALAADTSAPKSTPPQTAVVEEMPPRGLTTETQLKFTTPNPAGREHKALSSNRNRLNIATNILRPAGSTPAPASQLTVPSAATAGAATGPAKTGTYVPTTHWIAKRQSPLPEASTESAPAVAARTSQAPAAAPSAAPPAGSSVVANTFGGPVTKPDAPQTALTSQPAQQRTEPAQPAPKTVAPSVTMPDRAEALAQAESAPAEVPASAPPTYLAKTPSHIRPRVPTRVDAPAKVAEPEALAPLVDAATVRAKLASKSSDETVPVRAATRQSTPPAAPPATPGSWMATYERLVQRPEESRQNPRPPSGSPSRSLRSDDEPALPEPPPTILRR